ncbi:MAG: putative PEP-binding protein, partial [Limnohabitans sp.]
LHRPVHHALAVELMADTIAEGRRQGKPVSVCGEMAGDLTMTRLLLGLGLRSFSMHPTQILPVKQKILHADTRRLTPWAQQILDSDDPASLMISA